ncbi:hypothetical protein NLM33_48685 (plasmid) [Bradyrhizobium sp. CCGUVB1N3]|uniref:hypothetical protein n=1 Tax=Bradyrhizobium sp. CCGUVB1N3 TaxID=2949629 RepID=UPI0020B2F79C|nr:hypothetical protein [Bradyrhizobium sp. CCGUVB1N3]MCP3477952.1 hypothetical protein [Bradyrhizobium sp. CCGUVB1N3]
MAIDAQNSSGSGAAITPNLCIARTLRVRIGKIGTEHVDRGFPAASGLSTALWGGAFGLRLLR